jgi:hypothetical protein
VLLARRVPGSRQHRRLEEPEGGELRRQLTAARRVAVEESAQDAEDQLVPAVDLAGPGDRTEVVPVAHGERSKLLPEIHACLDGRGPVPLVVERIASYSSKPA